MKREPGQARLEATKYKAALGTGIRACGKIKTRRTAFN